MQWSQLKKRIETGFAESVAGRVEIWSTRYRRAHDDAGEAWITIDKVKVAAMGNCRWRIALYENAGRLQEERGCSDYQDDAQNAGYHQALAEARTQTQASGVFSDYDFRRSLFAFLNLSIDDALASEDPIIRTFAMLDRRFGKRRVMAFDSREENPLVRQLHEFRHLAETGQHKMGAASATIPLPNGHDPLALSHHP